MLFLLCLLIASLTQGKSNFGVGDINPKLVEAKYAVRGAILARAQDLKKELKEENDLPFDEIIHCNIGNPQALGQKPISFYRQVLSGVLNPSIVEQYPEDVKSRVSEILGATASNSIGAYTHSQGLLLFREKVANFIERRDGYPANPDHIFLTDGASAGVKNLMMAFIFKPNHGVLIPIPQYPLYTATLSLLGGQVVPYNLLEDGGWSMDVGGLEGIILEAKAKGIEVRGIVLINPGNPTGNCLSKEQLVQVVKIAEKHNVMILADEVYQINVYNPDLKFVSMKKVVRELGSKVPLISFHSTSKGLIGECGLRGGYFELVNIDAEIKDQIYKLASISLCPNTVGQMATSLMVDPPKPSDASYNLFTKERKNIFDSLKRKAAIVSIKLNEIEGISTQTTDGAMYSFPLISLPQWFINEADGVAPDALYCMLLLEKTGIVTVPGSGFRQVEGTWHMRLTILPPEAKIPEMMNRIKTFHDELMAQGPKEEL